MSDSSPINGEYSTLVLREIVHLFCGDLLGRGQDRDVYAHAQDPKKVIKIERSAGSFQNVIEWETWKQLSHTPYKKYLAPCHAISSCGVVLIQTRVTPLPPAGDPALTGLRLPDFLVDFKRSNYGMLHGQVVANDYGLTIAMNHRAFASKLTRVIWRKDLP
jgi:hypothetical protein